MRILWDKFEAAILLDKLIDVLEEIIPRKNAIEYVSKVLREYAIRRNLVIDDIYRNINGIKFQMSIMEYIFTNGKTGIDRQSKLFQEIVDLYKNDREKYEEILKEAKEKITTTHSIQDEFFAWLSKRISPAQLSEIYITYTTIEDLCFKENLINAKLFEMADFNAINNLLTSINSNKKILRKYKYNLNKINTAMQYYSLFLKEQGYFNNNVEVQNNEQVVMQDNKQSETQYNRQAEMQDNKQAEMQDNKQAEMQDNKQVEIQDKKQLETQYNKQAEMQPNKTIELKNSAPENTVPVPVVDEVKTNRKAFITWLNANNITGAAVFKYLSAIKECDKAARSLTIIDKDLYLITDAQNLTRIRDILSYTDEFKTSNKRQNNLLLTVFNKLIEFRQSAVTKKAAEVVEEKLETTSSASENVEDYTRCAEILSKYFGENGYQPNRPIYRNRFKNYFFSDYGEKLGVSDEQLDDILRRIGTQRDDKIFPKQDQEQNNLIETIVNDIISALQTGASAVYINAVYEKYKKSLADGLQIYNEEAMIPLILKNTKGKFFQYNTYFTNNLTKVNPTNDILTLMKESHQPLSYDDIHKKLWYIPYNKMKSLLYQEKSIVYVAAEMYFYAPNLPVDEAELQKITSLIRSEIDFHGYITDVKMMTLIQEKYPITAMNLEGFSTYGIRNCLGYILADDFTFKGPIISAPGSQLKLSEVYSEFAREHEILTLEELKNFAKEMNTTIYWDSVLSEMIRISQTQLVRKDLINFNVSEIDDIIDGMFSNDYISIKDISLFLSFPNIGYSWNSYILESYIFNCSRKFKLIHASFSENTVCGAIVRIDSPITDYRSLIVDVLSRSDSLSSDDKALQLIVAKGYQQRKSNKEIGRIIKEAKLIKENREKQEI